MDNDPIRGPRTLLELESFELSFWRATQRTPAACQAGSSVARVSDVTNSAWVRITCDGIRPGYFFSVWRLSTSSRVPLPFLEATSAGRLPPGMRGAQIFNVSPSRE